VTMGTVPGSCGGFSWREASLLPPSPEPIPSRFGCSQKLWSSRTEFQPPH
jgi:hypothetical protein